MENNEIVEDLKGKYPAASRGNSESPDKIEPLNRNDEARDKLMKAIHSRRAVIQSGLTWDAKTALDEAEFAMIKSVSEPLGGVVGHLEKSRDLLVGYVKCLAGDAERINDLINLARHIKQGEEAL